jgi:hypothetical protein
MATPCRLCPLPSYSGRADGARVYVHFSTRGQEVDTTLVDTAQHGCRETIAVRAHLPDGSGASLATVALPCKR